MFDSTSRYYKFETSTLQVPDSEGEVRDVRYIKRRFIPGTSETVSLLDHTVVQGDRLDNIAARYLGDPLQFWRICDTNLAMRPWELTEEVGAVIHITLPHPAL